MNDDLIDDGEGDFEHDTEMDLRMLDDLQMQSMIFDMAVDYESLTLTPKSDYQEPSWITKWKNREGDFDERFDIDAE